MSVIYEPGEVATYRGTEITNGLWRLRLHHPAQTGSGFGVTLYYCYNSNEWREVNSFDAGWLYALANVAEEARRICKDYEKFGPGGYAGLSLEEFMQKLMGP